MKWLSDEHKQSQIDMKQRLDQLEKIQRLKGLKAAPKEINYHMLTVCEAIPLIVNDKLYVVKLCTCNVVTASLYTRTILQSSNNNTSSSEVWTE